MPYALQVLEPNIIRDNGFRGVGLSAQNTFPKNDAMRGGPV